MRARRQMQPDKDNGREGNIATWMLEELLDETVYGVTKRSECRFRGELTVHGWSWGNLMHLQRMVLGLSGRC